MPREERDAPLWFSMRRILLRPRRLRRRCAAPRPRSRAPPVVTTVELTRPDGAQTPPAPSVTAASRSPAFTGVVPGGSSFRTRSLAGRWSAWRPAAPEDEDGPDPGSPRDAPAGLAARQSVVGRAVGPDRGAHATGTRSARMRAHLVWSPESRVPYRAPAATAEPAIVPAAGVGRGRVDPPRRRRPTRPRSASRSSTTRRARTATREPRRRDRRRDPALPRAGERLERHRLQLPRRPLRDGVRGPLRGYRRERRRRPRARIQHRLGRCCAARHLRERRSVHGRRRTPLARLLAWRLDLAHVDPPAALTFVSGRERALRRPGSRCSCEASRGTATPGLTECPGDALYGRLRQLARRRARIGLPKLYEPRVESGGAFVRFRARLSTSQPWTVTVTDAQGVEVARGPARDDGRLDVGLRRPSRRASTRGRSASRLGARPRDAVPLDRRRGAAARDRDARGRCPRRHPNGDGQPTPPSSRTA